METRDSFLLFSGRFFVPPGGATDSGVGHVRLRPLRLYHDYGAVLIKRNVCVLRPQHGGKPGTIKFTGSDLLGDIVPQKRIVTGITSQKCLIR